MRRGIVGFSLRGWQGSHWEVRRVFMGEGVGSDGKLRSARTVSAVPREWVGAGMLDGRASGLTAPSARSADGTTKLLP